MGTQVEAGNRKPARAAYRIGFPTLESRFPAPLFFYLSCLQEPTTPAVIEGSELVGPVGVLWAFGGG